MKSWLNTPNTPASSKGASSLMNRGTNALKTPAQTPWTTLKTI